MTIKTSKVIDLGIKKEERVLELNDFDDEGETELSNIEISLFDADEINSEVNIDNNDIDNFEVNDTTEIISDENNKDELIFEKENHLFESIIEIESKMNSSEIDTKTIEAVDESQKGDLQDPFNSSVSDFQKQRSTERRLRMKEFNYKFNKSKIDDIENEPAYKRRGVELENKNYSEENEISRTSISLDENDDIKIRKNNSFLHDNVD